MIDGIVSRKIERAVAKIPGVSPAEVKQTGQDIRVTEEERGMIGGLCASLAVKYGLLGQYAPEVLLVGVVAGWSGRVFWAFKRIDELASQKPQAPRDGEKRDGKN